MVPWRCGTWLPLEECRIDVFLKRADDAQLVEPKEQLGRNLRRLRHERGLSQMEMGFLLDLDLAEISRLENGYHDPGLSRLTRIAVALGVTFDELLAGILGPASPDTPDDRTA